MTKWFCCVTCSRYFYLYIKKLLYNVTHQVRCYHFFIVKIINESVGLMQMSKLKRKEYYLHDGEQLTFIEKYYISKHRQRKEECGCNLCIAMNSSLLDKNCTQDKVKCHIQQWKNLTKMNRNKTRKSQVTLLYFLLIFPERNFVHTLSKPLWKK